jgi:cytochrome bd-type quinol oxidase subunit 2
MPWLKPVLWLVSLSFAAFSLWVLMQVGYLGIWQGGFANFGSTQITLDLVIACTLLLGFIVRDCRAQGRPWWPWALLTLVAGSIGALAYLLWPRR